MSMMSSGGEEEELSSTPSEPMATPTSGGDSIPVRLFPCGI